MSLNAGPFPYARDYSNKKYALVLPLMPLLVSFNFVKMHS